MTDNAGNTWLGSRFMNQETKLDFQRTRLHANLVLLLFGITFIPAFALFAGSSIRFIVYIIPFASIALWFLFSVRHKLMFDKRYFFAMLCYLLLIIVILFISPEPMNWNTWINTLRPIFYIAIFIPLLIFNSESVKILVIIFGLTTLALAFTGISTTSGGFNLAESQGPLESGLAFPLGGILLYFIIQRDRLWAVVTFLLFAIAFKRIAFLGVGLVLALMMLEYLVAKYIGIKRKLFATIMVVTILTATSLINIYYYEFFMFMADIVGTEKSVTELTMGRLQEFTILSAQYGSQDLINILLGNGPGDSTRRFVEVTITYPLQVHNSYLIYFYDFGIVGFLIMLITFGLIYSKNRFGLYLLVYNFVIMLTDNAFHHHFHQITYFILISAMSYETMRKKEALDAA